jgi:hypothetical protein
MLCLRPVPYLSPVPITMPRAEPAVTMVVKKQRLAASRGTVMSLPFASRASSGDRSCASDSPVSDELSTFMSLAVSTRMSAGTWSPSFSSTMSPAGCAGGGVARGAAGEPVAQQMLRRD